MPAPAVLGFAVGNYFFLHGVWRGNAAASAAGYCHQEGVNLQLIFSPGRETSASSRVGMKSFQCRCVGWQAIPRGSGARGKHGCFAFPGEIPTGSYQQLSHLRQQTRCRWEIAVPAGNSRSRDFPAALQMFYPFPQWKSSPVIFWFLLFFHLKIKRREIVAIYGFGESILAGFPGMGQGGRGSIPMWGRVSFVFP